MLAPPNPTEKQGMVRPPRLTAQRGARPERILSTSSFLKVGGVYIACLRFQRWSARREGSWSMGYLFVVNSGSLVASGARRPISPWMSPKTHRSLTLSPQNVKIGAPYHHTWRPVGAWPNIGFRWMPWKRSLPETTLPSSKRSRMSDV